MYQLFHNIVLFRFTYMNFYFYHLEVVKRRPMPKIQMKVTIKMFAVPT